MDPTRFDTFIRSLSQRTPEVPSRRTLLHALGGLFAASAMTASESDARRKGKHKKCKGGKKKCGKKCIPKSNCCTSADCDDGETCQNGSCVASVPCPPNQTRCGGQCVDTLTDSANCGACGNGCAAGATCRLGDCCRSHGETCVSEDQCCFAFCGAIDEVKPTGRTCHLPGVSARCCADGDIPCLDTCDCCGSLICQNQQCCVASGQPCSNDAQCCSLTCGPVGTGPTCY